MATCQRYESAETHAGRIAAASPGVRPLKGAWLWVDLDVVAGPGSAATVEPSWERYLRFEYALDVARLDELPDAPGLYAIWHGKRLFYVGMTTMPLTKKCIGYLKSRPNETIYLYILDYLRPNLQEDERSSLTIARTFLAECFFAGCPLDVDEATLFQLETQARTVGIDGQLPIANPTGRRRQP